MKSFQIKYTMLVMAIVTVILCGLVGESVSPKIVFKTPPQTLAQQIAAAAAKRAPNNAAMAIAAEDAIQAQMKKDLANLNTFEEAKVRINTALIDALAAATKYVAAKKVEADAEGAVMQKNARDTQVANLIAAEAAYTKTAEAIVAGTR
jgi:hypothetical protein